MNKRYLPLVLAVGVVMCAGAATPLLFRDISMQGNINGNATNSIYNIKIGLSNLLSGGASISQALVYNGTNWVPGSVSVTNGVMGVTADGIAVATTNEQAVVNINVYYVGLSNLVQSGATAG